MNPTNIIYDVVRNWILRKRNSINHRTQQEFTWEEIRLAGKSDENRLKTFLEEKVEDDSWPLLTIEEWYILVNSQRKAEEDTIKIAKENGAAEIYQQGQDNGLTIPLDECSAWQCYKRGQMNKGLKKETVEQMEHAALRILKRLNEDTRTTGAVKGMVVGNVQSGKTANMGALMAMAADWGWNMFIVLSGTIESLRIQTLRRLIKDLQKRECRLNWTPINRLSLKDGEMTIQPTELWLNDDDRSRYFTVCLKNSSRLRSMLQYLQHDANIQRQLKILVIEDEADQASINTSISADERTQINRLLCNLVNGQTHDDKPCESSYKSMNYVGYTATPYANVLNEATPESLYPKDFITTLAVSKEYFGPQQIFGIEGGNYEGLDIVRRVSENDLDMIKDIHDGISCELPQSLKDAICWFFCGVGAMRYWGYRKPISMLVHTSQKTSHHSSLANSIQGWIKKTDIYTLLSMCENVWIKETKRFSLEKFKDQYPDYGREFNQINKYPQFKEITSNISELLAEERVESIQIDNTNATLRYHKQIHLCIDNSVNNNGAPNEQVRLVYPTDKELETLGTAPAFIVIGGATLSRGLTIEGLISTYFLRAAKQSDTLMQMGRWFGYRKDYELIPRLWMTDTTKEQFKFLSYLDQELRDEIHQMSARGISPTNYGPKVKASPKLSFIRVVANNKMQAAQPTDLNYSGSSSQTYLFDRDETILQENLDNTRDFLLGLGKPEERKEVNKHAKNSFIWRNIKFSEIKPYLNAFHFQTRQGVFNDLSTLIEWVEKITENGDLKPWNIVLVGAGSNGTNRSVWEVSENVHINKVIRSQKILENQDANLINIGALRSPKDIISDIDLTNVSDSVKDKVAHFDSSYGMELRDEAGLEGVPQLLVYIIDKDSKASKRTTIRKDLEAPVDIAGICINIPGESNGRNCFTSLSIPMPPAVEQIYNDNGDLDGTDED